MGTALPSQRAFPRLALKQKMLRLALKQKMLRLDQAKISDNVIRKSDMGESKWLNAVSKCQCKIVMN